MNDWKYRCQRFLRRIRVVNLMNYMVAGMGITFALDLLLRPFGIYLYGDMMFVRALALRGEIWRFVSFLFLPPNSSLIFIVFSLYFYWMIGMVLEREWGSHKFTLFYLCGALGSIIAGLITGAVTNTYLNLSLFLAYAILFPNEELLLFFIVPVKVKYLAWVDVALYVVMFIKGTMDTRLAILFAFLNIILFFGGDLLRIIQQARRRQEWRNKFR